MNKTGSNRNSPLEAAAGLPGTLRLEEIAEFLYEESAHPHTDLGLAHGKLGPFLFLYAYSGWLGGHERYESRAEEVFMDVVRALYRREDKGLLYYREVAELGMLVGYLQTREYLDDSFSEVLGKVDAVALQGLERFSVHGNYDPFTGYLPLGRYSLSRNTPEAREVREGVLDNLWKIRETGPEGIYFRSRLFDSGRIYLGWSHGLAAIALFLCRWGRYEPLPARGMTLLKGITDFIRAQAVEGRLHLYPDILETPKDPSPLNLCYGDLGITYALLESSRVLDDPALEDLARGQILYCSGRRDLAGAGIKDPSLIYGAMGTALFFRHLREDEAAGYWYGQAMALSNHPDQPAGYDHYFNKGKKSVMASLFEGVAGFGLGILEHEGADLQLLPLVGY